MLRQNACCVSFYGWHRVEHFVKAWRAAGFRLSGHFVFPKSYPSGRGLVSYQHEQAYLLSKGAPQRPAQPLSDVLPWRHTGNRFHPTQKPLCALMPIVKAFSAPGDLVLDPFCGSGSTLIAARLLGRRFYGIELDGRYCELALARLRSSDAARKADAPD